MLIMQPDFCENIGRRANLLANMAPTRFTSSRDVISSLLIFVKMPSRLAPGNPENKKAGK